MASKTKQNRQRRTAKPQAARRPARATARPSGGEVIAGAAIALLALLAFLPVLRAGFIWDDPDYVVNNHTLRDLGGLWEMWTRMRSIPQWYPLTHTTFWIEYQWWGATRATGYHVTNLVLHAASAMLLWRLLAHLRVPGAWLAAAVFAVHPVMVESVAWVTERKNVLSMLFYLLALRAYLISLVHLDEPDAPAEQDFPVGRMRSRAYVVAFVLFGCALLSKTVTASLPAAILLILWWKRGRIRPGDVVALIPFFIVGLALASVTGYLETHHVGAQSDRIVELNLSPVQRLFIAGRAVWFYAGKLLWPTNLAFIYPRWASVEQARPWLWAFPLAAGGVVAALFGLRHRIGRGPVTAVLSFCGTLVPALGFVNVYPMRFSFVADHFQYHASVGLIVLLCALLWRAVGRVQPYLVVPVVLAPLVVLTFRRATVYESAETLWRDTIARNPDSWMVNTNLANELVAQDRPQEAAEYYLRALELAPYLHDTHTNAGSVYGMRGQYDRAVAEFQEALRINPGFAPAYYNWGQVLERQGKPDEALVKYREALALKPFYPEANYKVARILAARGDEDRAIEHYRTAIAYNPAYVDARNELAALVARRGLLDEAMANWIEVLRLRPNDADAWTNLGFAQLMSGHAGDAATSFQRALHARPGDPRASAGLQRARSGR